MVNSTNTGAQLLLEGSAGTVLWRLAAPNVIAVATMTAVTFADAWYVGQLGTAALASLALVFPFLTLMQMMGGGAIGGGTTSAVARAVGAGHIEYAESLAWHAMLIAAALAAIYTLVLGAFAEPIFKLLGGKGQALDGAVDYAQIVFGGAIATWFVFVVAAILRGTGDTVTPARAIATASSLQIVLSGALTLGWAGMPRLGVTGPAVAWVLCQGAAALYLTAYLARGKARLRLRPQAFDWRPVRDIMRVGGIGLLNSFCMIMTVVVVTGMVGRMGTQALAGYGLGARLELMLVPIAFGIGAALTAVVGINVGAGQHARARRITWIGAGVTLVITGAIGLTAAIAPGLWLNLFTTDAGAYAYGAQYLVIAAPLYGLFGAGQALYFASQGTGQMGWPVTVTVLRLVAVGALGSVAISLGWGVTGVFASVAIGLAVMGIGQAACLRARGWHGRAASRR